MFLSRIYLDPRSREARRDLADPYQMHSTLCRVFSKPDKKCPEAEFLWRLEPETDYSGHPCILIQSRSVPDWNGLGISGWLASCDNAIDLDARLGLSALKAGRSFRFRLRANPCVTRNGKRLGLLHREEQLRWIERKGQNHGFIILDPAVTENAVASKEQPNVLISQEQIFRCRQHSGNPIHIFSALYDGVLLVKDPDKFKEVLKNGIGHGKGLGLGLLSIASI